MKNEIVLPLYCVPTLAWFRRLEEGAVLKLVNYSIFPDEPEFRRIDFAGQQGLQQFTIPLVSESRKGDYKSVQLSYQTNWHHQLINALKTAYGKSPYYEYYDYRLEPILKAKPQFLYELNLALLKFVVQALKLDVEILESEGGDFEKPEFEENARPYYQVFADRNGFIGNLSVLDYLFNEGWDNFQISKNS